jgi:uncharacterized membrane protein
MNTETHRPPESAFGKHLRARLVSGLLVLVPLAITLFVLNLLLKSLTAFMRPLIRPWAGVLPPYAVTLTALIVAVGLIYGVGLIATHILGRRMIRWGEHLIMRLPLVKTVYAASKQVVEAFSSPTQAAFSAVALIEFPRRGAWVIGFVTGTLLNPQGEPCCRVFVATTPNPTSGFLVILPQSDVQFTDISVEDGLKMVVSGGMLSPASYRTRPAPAQTQTPAIPDPLQTQPLTIRETE